MRAAAELLRFGAVGLVSNTILYLLYLVLTAAGMGHKSALTLLYMLGGAQGFLLNSRWTFPQVHVGGSALARYWMAYLACYLVNLALLAALVDLAGLPHRPVQAAMVLFIAGLSFLLQKSWVFGASRAASSVARR